MSDAPQAELFSDDKNLDLVRVLLADLHDDLLGKVARFHQLQDLSLAMGSSGTMMPGGEVALAAWLEARSSFIHGNYMATVLLSQSLAEQMLAAHLALAGDFGVQSRRPAFRETLNLCLIQGVLSEADGDELSKLMELRNPLSHYRGLQDPSNLSRRVISTMRSAESHLLSDATFAISVIVRLLALPAFRLGD